MSRMVRWLGVAHSKFYDWRTRYGLANEHNAPVPRDFWLEDWEKVAIMTYARAHPLEGYRRLAFMMLDDDIVAVSPSSAYRVLRVGAFGATNPPPRSAAILELSVRFLWPRLWPGCIGLTEGCKSGFATGRDSPKLRWFAR